MRNIVQINEEVKLWLIEVNKAKQKFFCEWVLERIKQYNNILIYNNKSWYEIRVLLYKKKKILVLKG